MEQIIGIDPDIDKSGVAIIINNNLDLYNYNFNTLSHVFFKNLRIQMDERPDIHLSLYIEAGYLNKKFYQPCENNPFVIGKLNRSIGENHGVAKLIIQAAEYYKLNPIPVYPVTSTNYRQKGKKITHPEFLKMISINNINYLSTSTNQEARDAALIAITYGINLDFSKNNGALKNKQKYDYHSLRPIDV